MDANEINDGTYYLYSDSEKGFWNNDSGWGAFESAQEYSEDDLNQPMLKGSRFVTYGDAVELADDPE
jgi:hypothetical protein